MSFLSTLKAKRAAKKAKQQFDKETAEWELEKQTLTQMLDIFSKASKGEEPHDQSLVDRKSTRLNSSHVSESRMPSSA